MRHCLVCLHKARGHAWSAAGWSFGTLVFGALSAWTDFPVALALVTAAMTVFKTEAAFSRIDDADMVIRNEELRQRRQVVLDENQTLKLSVTPKNN